MYVSKWYSYSAAGCLQLCAGIAYTFSLYSGAVKQAKHFTQPELEGLGSALLSGGLFAVLPGLSYDALADRHHLGPRLIAGIGLLSHSVGYFGIWVIASGHIVAPYWLLIMLGLVASSGLLWLDTASIITSVRNAPTYRGDVAGAHSMLSQESHGLTLSLISSNATGSLKTYLGLSASIAATIYAGAFSNGLSFLLFLAIAPPALGLLVLPLLNHVPYVEECELDLGTHTKPVTRQRFLAIYCVIGILLVYQLTTALIGQLHPLNAQPLRWIMIGALVLLSITLLTPLGAGSLVSKPASGTYHARVDAEEQASLPLIAEASTADVDCDAPDQLATMLGVLGSTAAEQEQCSKAAGSISPRDWSLRQCVASMDFWLLYSGFAINIGGGFVYLSNLGQHVESLHGAKGSQAIYVLIFTSFSCAGRMICGFVSEWLLHRGHARTVVLVGASATTAVVYLAIAFARLRLLIPCSVIAGLAFGFHWSLMPVLTSDIFGYESFVQAAVLLLPTFYIPVGLRHFASNQSVMHMSTAVGGFLLSSQLAGRLYAYEGHCHGDAPGTCQGASCFRTTFLVIAAVAAAQTIAAMVIHVRMRSTYQELYKRLHCFDEGRI